MSVSLLCISVFTVSQNNVRIVRVHRDLFLIKYVLYACSLSPTYESKLVARNAEDAEVLELGLECIQGVVLRRGASEGRHVDQQDDAAGVRRPVDSLMAVNVADLVVVDATIAGQRVVAQRLDTQNIFG